MPLLAAIVVHWCDEARLAMLAAAWPRDDPRFELVIVDNSGSARLPADFALPADIAPSAAVAPPAATTRLPAGPVSPPVRMLRPGRNLGFAGGVNAGVAASRAPLLLLMNPDVLPEPGALDGLLAGFAAHPEAAGLAPRLAGEDGRPQLAWQLRRVPSLWGCLRQTLPWPTADGARRAPARPAVEPAAGTPVEQPAAAALALRREALLAAGGLDERFHPAWFEDVDLACRLRQAGARLLYWPAARFRHALGSTVPRLGYGRFLWIYHRNLERYMAKHHGAGWALVSRASLAAGLLLRLPLTLVRRPRRAASRREGAAGLLVALAGALSGWRLPRRLALDPAGPQIESATAAAAAAAVQAAPRVPVAVCIVTHNSAPDLADCMAAIAALRPRPLEVALVDSGSADGSLEAARRAAPPGLPLSLAAQAANVGFAAAMNAAIAATSAPYVLTLNADARPRPDYLARLVARFEAHPGLRVAAVTGRLVRPAGSAATGGSRGRPAGRDLRGVPHVHPGRAAAATGNSRGRPDPAPGGGPRLLDACGMQLTRSWRHLDRGSGEPDRGQWALPERVFGATGAATLFRREALLDAAVDGEVFDPRFHSFREDAELCFRLRERGWEVLYEPAAVAEHRRFNLPERRSAMPAEVNFHSLKNRYLLRVYHQTGRNLLSTLLPALGRDLAALAWVLLAERSSLGAYGWLLRHHRELLARRRAIQRRRTVPAAELDRWFGRAGAPL